MCMPDVLLQLRSHQYAYEASGVFSLRCNHLHAFHTSKVIAFSSFVLQQTYGCIMHPFQFAYNIQLQQ